MFQVGSGATWNTSSGCSRLISTGSCLKSISSVSNLGLLGFDLMVILCLFKLAGAKSLGCFTGGCLSKWTQWCGQKRHPFQTLLPLVWHLLLLVFPQHTCCLLVMGAGLTMYWNKVSRFYIWTFQMGLPPDQGLITGWTHVTESRVLLF